MLDSERKRVLPVRVPVITAVHFSFHDRLYVALVSILQSLKMSDCQYCFKARFEYPLKCCTYSGVWLLRGWCHMKLLPSRRILCTPYNHTPCHVTSCKTTKVRCLSVQLEPAT